MENEHITRAEHNEFSKRIDKDISELSDRVNIVEKLVSTVERLATNMENMLKEQVAQGKRIQVLEEKDGKIWQDVVRMVLGAAIGCVIGYLFGQ